MPLPAPATIPAGHRPWPPPRAPWLMAMSWCDLAFLHWPVPADALAPLLPPPLALDTWEGRAWLGVVPFRMERVRARGLPPLPGTRTFPELNVRTYVVAPGGRGGVWFFSLDAANPVAVRAARLGFGLPYFDARMAMVGAGGAPLPPATSAAAAGEPGPVDVGYRSERTHRGAPDAAFRAEYGADGPALRAAPGTLEHWLTERYALFALRRGRVVCGEIHHPPWTLHAARVAVAHNTMAAPIGVALPAEPTLAHVTRRLDVVAWPPRPIAAPAGRGRSSAAGADWP